MLFKKNIIIIVDAYSTGSMIAPAFISKGFNCVHVKSTDIVNPFYIATYRTNDFIKNFSYFSECKLKENLQEFHVLYVLAGCESGVELAAKLAHTFQTPQLNDPDQAILLRNKYLMHETLKRAKIASIKHFRSNSLPTIIEWAKNHEKYPVVVKPIDSAGTDNVHICQSLEEIEYAFNCIIENRTIFLDPNHEVLIQEYLDNSDFSFENTPHKKLTTQPTDVEYCVNTVSLAGKHYVSEIIRVYRVRVNDSPVHDYNELLCPIENRRTYEVLSRYVFNVLDALNLKYGVGHSEVMIVNDKPVLLETAGRLPGGIDLSAYTKALGYNQLELWILSLLDPGRFLDFISSPRTPLKFHSSCIFLISDQEGEIKNPPNIRSWKRSVTCLHSVKIQDKGYLQKTISLLDSPGSIFLLSENKKLLSSERQIVRLHEQTIYLKMLST